MTFDMPHAVTVLATSTPETVALLTPEALNFLALLHRTFNLTRRTLLARRAEVEKQIQRGWQPDFPPETAAVRAESWQVAPPPPDLERRWVEITGPTDRKMVINALNSGAHIFMADFEDSNVPIWDNLVQGQHNLSAAIRRTLNFTSPEGKAYHLNEATATLMVRPRGWHLDETHIMIDGEAMSASLFDFGLYLFHNADELLARGTGPYFYLPKMEHYLEARLWNDVCNWTEDVLGLVHGTIRVTVLLEHILLSFQIDEVLYELRDHIVGINAGRWDYIFSAIKKFRARMHSPLPDRAQVTMTTPFMRAYTERLVQICHRRGAHAMGGMSAYIPNRRDPDLNARALNSVRADKERECEDGFDGTWVAHPDLVPVALGVFAARLGDKPNQKDRLREEVQVSAAQLIDFAIPNGAVTEAGMRNNISVALQYIESWLRGIGAVAIFNLMEDAATAEIARSQLWQWVHHPDARLDDGQGIDAALYTRFADEEQARLTHLDSRALSTARALLDVLVLHAEYAEFLTIAAYARLHA